MQSINALWLKRDLRLTDHAPLQLAAESPFPVLLFYCFEPSLVDYTAYSLRHWRFIWQSLVYMQECLAPFGHRIHILWTEPNQTLEWISHRYWLRCLLSHQETGLQITFDRDRRIAAWCKQKGIAWYQAISNGVVRGLKHRNNWRQHWADFVNKPIDTVDLSRLKSIYADDLADQFPLPRFFQSQLIQSLHSFQPGGTDKGLTYLHSFLTKRFVDYRRHMSKPEASRRSCSRISPYIAWGCLSIRQVYQQAFRHFTGLAHTESIAEAFLSRLRWQGHFIQKFESECQIEYRNFNRGFDRLRTDWNEAHYQAWVEGRTGYPLVDASMRCLEATGWINFRMRAMLVSFLTHHLWLDWQAGARYLGRLFLDFEPGIHYPQFHMQAGTTGIHTLRIYNPERQAQLHDPQAVFIKKWVPELRSLPPSLAIAPYRMTYLEEICYEVRLDIDYPRPVVDIRLTYQQARERLWHMQQTDALVRAEAQRILRLHTTSDRKV